MPPTNSPALLPCPFCGCSPIPYDGDFKLVHSPSCYLINEHGWIVGSTKMKRWNTRTPSLSLTQDQSELENQATDLLVNLSRATYVEQIQLVIQAMTLKAPTQDWHKAASEEIFEAVINHVGKKECCDVIQQILAKHSPSTKELEKELINRLIMLADEAAYQVKFQLPTPERLTEEINRASTAIDKAMEALSC